MALLINLFDNDKTVKSSLKISETMFYHMERLTQITNKYLFYFIRAASLGEIKVMRTKFPYYFQLIIQESYIILENQKVIFYG